LCAGFTPRRGDGTIAATPARDTLGINAVDGETPRMTRDDAVMQKHSLLAGLRSLPKPKNDFSIVAGDVDGEEDEELGPEEDAADRDARDARARAEAEAREMARRSMAIQRGLPRPTMVNKAVAAGDVADADKLVREEMVRMLQADMVRHPIGNVQGMRAPALDTFTDEELAQV
jgi:pre-mRNA-splicing factor CDC5/CEF1